MASYIPPDRSGDSRKRDTRCDDSDDSDQGYGPPDDRVFEATAIHPAKRSVEPVYAGAEDGVPSEPPSLVDDKWVDEDELCTLLASKGRMAGHLLRDCGRVDFPVEVVVVHVADEFAVLYDTTDNHLYIAPYIQEGGADGLDYKCDITNITKLDCSHGYDLDDLPLFSTCDAHKSAAHDDPHTPTHILGVCDNIGQVRVWDAVTGKPVLAFQCTRTPGDSSSKLVKPNAFCMSITHAVIVTAPADTHSVIYYRPLDWTGIITEAVMPADIFIRGRHRTDGHDLAKSTSSDGATMSLLMTKLCGIRAVSVNAPNIPSLFWFATSAGVASFNARLPEFAAALIPSLDWPAYISPKYNLGGPGIRYTSDAARGEEPTMTADQERDRIAAETAVKMYITRITDWAAIPAIHAVGQILRAALEGREDRVDCILATLVVALGHTTAEDADALFDVDPATYTAADALLGSFIGTQTKESTKHIGAIMPLWIEKVCMSTAFAVHDELERYQHQHDGALPDAALSPMGHSIPIAEALYEYTRRRFGEDGGSHIVLPAPSTANRSVWFGKWHVRLVEGINTWMTRAEQDAKLINTVRVLKMGVLDPVHRPTSIAVHGSRTIATIGNEAIVWTDMLSRVAAPVRVTEACYGVPLDHGTAVMCGDALVRFVEEPVPGTSCAVTTMFLRAGGDSIESARVTDNVGPHSAIARIDGSTVAVTRFDNAIWFFRASEIVHGDTARSDQPSTEEDRLVSMEEDGGAAAAAAPKPASEPEPETMPTGVAPADVPRQNWYVPNEVPKYRDYREMFGRDGRAVPLASIPPPPADDAAAGSKRKSCSRTTRREAAIEDVEDYCDWDPVWDDAIPYEPVPTAAALDDFERSGDMYEWASRPPDVPVGDVLLTASGIANVEDGIRTIVRDTLDHDEHVFVAAAAAAGPGPARVGPGLPGPGPPLQQEWDDMAVE